MNKVRQEIKKELTQQSENFQKRLAERRKKLKRATAENSRAESTERQGGPVGSSPIKQGARPQTVRGQRFITNFEEDLITAMGGSSTKDFNDISLIKGSTNLETTQFLEENSFHQDFQLINKKLQEIGDVELRPSPPT